MFPGADPDGRSASRPAAPEELRPRGLPRRRPRLPSRPRSYRLPVYDLKERLAWEIAVGQLLGIARGAAIDLDLLVEHHERMEADESASRADQHSTGVSAVERAKVRAIRLRPGQQDQVGLQVEVDPTAGRTGIGRSLSDSVLQVFKVECQSRSLLHTFRGQTCQLLQRTGLAPASARICDWLARSAQSARVATLGVILAPRATPAPNRLLATLPR